ncbi:hypothetical protein [Calothrix sp. PCC 6303]|uniref:hypothetical protein n=1 Tax=Calothrix sp. PCC 6303 TaxID=1170562 RepID=UPI00030C9642|nr:hypothetical protein [Calothrix sp. PCC 6303]
MNQNGNGHRGFWNPVKIFIRLFQGVWKKRDEVSGETYLVDSETVSPVGGVGFRPVELANQKG